MTTHDILLGSIAFCSYIYRTAAQNTTANEHVYDVDPYLQYRPPFARSLPVQILLTGVVLTLVAVLFIHLIFTAQYHWPLAPVNYVLQISGVSTLLISLIATLHVVLSDTMQDSQKWPYMLSYIAVNVPPLDMIMDAESTNWSLAERATWLVMNATTSGLIQITHIQFLTLLYPSKLEGRLIFTLLGPLAIVAAIMQLLPIQANMQVNSIASAVRNVCNATLSLLFTASLFIWGLLVNRRQAWRTDGGTAAFGCAALVLALVSTALNFLYVPRQEEYVWLPGLMWAVVLWQSFLGWWWWVGAGSGSGLMSSWEGKEDMPEILRREERRREKRRKDRGKRTGETKERARSVWNRVVSRPFENQQEREQVEPSISRRTPHPNPSNNSPPTSPYPPSSPPIFPVIPGPPFTTSTPSVSSVRTYTTFPHILPSVIHRWYASLRYAHLTAARQQDVERLEQIREANRAVGGSRRGWALGSFAWRIGRERERSREVRQEYELRDRPERKGRRRDVMLSQNLAAEVPEPPPPERNDDDVEDGTVTREERATTVTPPADVPHSAAETPRPHSMWWWGPLRRWRLQDSTVY